MINTLKVFGNGQKELSIWLWEEIDIKQGNDIKTLLNCMLRQIRFLLQCQIILSMH